MESDLKLIQECGFNSFEEVVKRINELVNIMRVGRAKAEKNLQRFNNQAKEYLKSGQKDKAKKELAKKKKKEERVKSFDTQFNVILEKLKEVTNSTKMLQVLNATKYCNNVLLAELSESEKEEGAGESKEYQDLVENNNEITKYIDIIVKATKKPEKIKPNIPQNYQYNNDIPQFNEPDLNFDNNQNQTQSDPNLEMNILKQCGFNTLTDAKMKIKHFTDVMAIGKAKVVKNIEGHYNQAKEYLKSGQKDEAKKELVIKKQKEEKIKTFDTQFNTVLSKLSEVKNSNQMLQVLNAIKYCNNLLLAELDKNEIGEETKEYQYMTQNDQEISKYIQIISSFNNMPNQNYPDINYQEQGNNNFGEDYTFPSDS